MRINNYYLSPITLSPAAGQPAADMASRDTSSPGPLEQSSTHTLSPELQHLISLAQSQPEVRTEVVAAAQNKLVQGVYATPASAKQTAEAILGTAG